MIASFGVEKKEVAKWAGATSCVFSLAQSLTAVPWGRASDRFGRKPIIMSGLLCTMIGFLIWGMSTNLPMAVAVRAIMGACNGNVGIIRTMVAEMVPEKELQPKAFSIMPLVWSIGSVFGPAFGGLFANPAVQWPGLFGNSQFHKAFPFALPNIMAAVIFMISVTTGLLFLKETLHSKRHSRDWGLIIGHRITGAFKEHPRRRDNRLRRYSFQDAEASAPLLTSGATPRTPNPNIIETKIEKSAPPSMRSVFNRQSVINLVSYTFLALHSVAYDQVLPVFLNYPRQAHTPENTSLPFVFSGGFGLASGHIGTIFTLYGIVCGLIQFLVFPMLCARFGVLACFKACVVTFPVVYMLTPFTVLIEDGTTRYAALLVVMVVKAFAVIVGFPCTTILLTNSATSLSILGTLNGFATTFSALGRASGPFITGLAFTWGVKHGVVGLPWWILAALAALGAVPAWMIVEGDGPSGASTNNSDDEEDTEVDDDEDDASVAASYRNLSDTEGFSTSQTTIVAGDTADALGVPEDETETNADANEDLLLMGGLTKKGTGGDGYGALVGGQRTSMRS
ncbi:major facilitator superfamily protein [Xylariaceae sp. FL0662B]|nr:major facilitator superfamily protein [Xylariaceae sp. FL0662B]